MEVNDKISLALAYGASLNDLINTLTTQGSGWGYTINPAPSTHPYYNNDRYSAYLRDAFDQDLEVNGIFRALPRYDRITIYPGIGDPTQAYGTGSFVVRFTKVLHGRIDGLVFRDLYPAGTITTKIEARKGGQTQDEQRTDERRYYRTKHLKAGTYEIIITAQSQPKVSSRFNVALRWET